MSSSVVRVIYEIMFVREAELAGATRHRALEIAQDAMATHQNEPVTLDGTLDILDKVREAVRNDTQALVAAHAGCDGVLKPVEGGGWRCTGKCGQVWEK